MSSNLGLGVPIPKMLPIVGTSLLPFALYQLLLNARVSLQRIDTNTIMGSTSNEPSKKNPSSSQAPSSSGISTPADPLSIELRSHANFIENVPLALTFAGVAELNGANRKVLAWMLAGLWALRVVHVELGMRAKEDGNGLGRFVGHLGTQGVLLGLAGWAGWLVRGYWGF